MTARCHRILRARAGAGGAAAAVVLALAGCTTSPEAGAPSTTSTTASRSGATGAGEEPTATDGPRPARTDVVLSTIAWDDLTGAVEAGGYVSPVVETGGTCTLRLEMGDDVVVVTGDALPDATTTVCGGLRTAPGALAGGRWTAHLDYRSATTEGSSAPLHVEVPG